MRRREPSSFCRLLLVICFLLLPGQASSAQLVLGLRADAPPFSFHDDDPVNASGANPVVIGDKVFRGIVVSICQNVIVSMLKSENFTPVFQEVETVPDRFDDLETGEIRVLCGPSTITQNRLKRQNLLVSQPLYLSGIGFARQVEEGKSWFGHWPCLGPFVGIVKSTTSETRGVERILEAGGFGAYVSNSMNSYPGNLYGKVTLTERHQNMFERCFDKVRGPKDVPEDLPPVTAGWSGDTISLVREYENHNDLAAAFCRGDIQYYVGDVEIVGSVLNRKARSDENCTYKLEPRTFSEERYGIFVHIAGDGSPEDRLAILFLKHLSIEIHKGKNSVLVNAIKNNFRGGKISPSLDVFIWNVVGEDDTSD